MFRTALAILALTASAFAADWTEYRSGPFRVVSNAGDNAARERLTELEQTRFVLSSLIGKKDLQTVFPITLVFFSNQKQLDAHTPPQIFIPGGYANLSAAADTKTQPQLEAWRREVVRQLLDDNVIQMPAATRTALGDLFSTIFVNGTHIYLGPKPTGALPPERLRAWAKLDFLVTQPDYAGRARVYINNIQSGDENLAVRNALNMSAAELDAKIDDYLSRGVFRQASMASEPINPNRDFVEKRLSQAQVSDLLAELDAAGKSFPPGSPRWLLGEATPTSLEAAAKANPRWGEPHFRLAALLDVPLAKVSELRIAASLEPGKSAYWQALAEAQTAVGQHDDAAKSWASAEHAAPTPADAERIHQVRLAADERKTDFILSERKRSADEDAADLQRVKDAAAARLHTTENEINQRLGLLDSKQPVAKWDEFARETVIGKVTRIDCIGASMKFTLQPSTGQAVVLWMPDPKAFFAPSQKTFTCGVPKQPVGVRIVHDTKADPKQGTAGEIRSIDTL